MVDAREARAEAQSGAAALFALHGALGTETCEAWPPSRSDSNKPADADAVASSEDDEEPEECGVRRWAQAMKSRNVYVIPNALSGVARASICVHDPDNLWKTIETEFMRRFKAVEYPWGGRTLRNIQVEIIDPQHRYLTYHASSPLDAYKIPYLHLYVLTCNNLDEYKAAIRQRLLAWKDELRHVSNGISKTEFLVIFVPQLHRVADVDKATVAAKRVFERVRLDVNEGGKEERCARISVFQNEFVSGAAAAHAGGKGSNGGQASSKGGGTGPEQGSEGQGATAMAATGDGEWTELMGLIFRYLSSAFELRCRKFEDQVLKLEGQVDAPGWNYCTYLIVKGNLAFTWLQIGQNYDALRVLDSMSMQFDNIIEGDLEPKRATNNLHIDLYRTQMLRLLLFGRHVGAPAPLQENPHPAQTARPSGASASSTEASAITPQETDQPLGPDGATQLMGQSKVVAARLARRLVVSLCFGSNGAARIESRKRRADSLAERSVYKGTPVSAVDKKHLERKGGASTESTTPSTPESAPPKLSSAPASAKTMFSDDFDQDDDDFVSDPSVSGQSAPRDTRSRRAHLPPIPCILLDAHRKPYREHIYKSAVSILEIRLYLFMRSTLLLFAVNRPDEALRRGLHFVSTFGRDLLHACDKWDRDSDSSAEGAQPDRSAGRIIAFCWTITACLELVSAGHAARAGVAGEPDTGPEVFLYQSELVAFAQSSFEHLVAEVRGASKDSSTANLEDSALPRRVWSSLKWIQRLPGFLSTVTASSAATTLPDASLAAWLPAGLLYALTKQPIGVEFYAHLMSCRAAYQRLARRHRCAFRIHLRSAALWISLGRLHDAQQVVYEIEDNEEQVGMIRPWPVLRAEHGILSAHVQNARRDAEATVKHALRVLSMFDARQAQRKAALELALTGAGRLERELRVPGLRYNLLAWHVRRSEMDEGPLLSPSSKRPLTPRGSRQNTLLSQRCGEVLNLELRVDSVFPSTMHFSRIYLRIKRLPPRSSLRVQIARGNPIDVHTMVRYRSSEAAGLPSPQDNNLPRRRNAAAPLQDGVESVSDSDATASPDTEFNTEEEDGGSEDEDENEAGFWHTHEDESLIRPSVAFEGENSATMDEALKFESFKPIRVDAAALRRVSISSRMSNFDSTPSGGWKKNQRRVHYFDATDVEIKPGQQDVALVAPAVDAEGRLLTPGTYEVDRVVFQRDKLRMVFPLDPGSFNLSGLPSASFQETTRIELQRMPSLFLVEVVQPIGGFVSLDGVPDKPVEVELRLRKSDFVRYPRLAGVRAKLDFGSNNAANLPLRLTSQAKENKGTSAESEVVDFGADELGSKGEAGTGGYVTKTIKFSVRVASKHSKEVDCLLQPNRADVQILRRKGLRQNDSSLIASWDLKVDLQARLDQVDARGEHHEVALDQIETVSLRYGAPFEISQCVRFRAGRIWFQLTLRNNLPYAAMLDNAKLTLAEEADQPSLERVSARDAPDVIAAGHEAHLTFSTKPLPQMEPSAIHRLCFSTHYSPAEGATTDSGGIFTRTVALRQELDRRCLSVKSTCTNTDTVHLGSTATFVYKLGRPQADKTVRVESIFAESTDLINVSTSPLRNRHASRRLRRPGSASPSDPAAGDDAASSDSLVVEFLLAFDPTKWMLVGTERGHIDLESGDTVMCEFIPLQAGELAFPVLEILNFESAEGGPRSFVRVSDAT
ncbi:Trafficking protein particle complex subunit 10 [Hondaea fermentalgiana]|uniref:Trafficking protein particle complex subunit 10 n=1 Tax=Hondaea fermentalgiana TaxID=2315210 RepID=A0A2R5GQ53_9STRA|nr:Trafficking protein particle complex subunit 10 [Hondaea fermentalgiana]|eukprot:GBG30753.1 Trafficking protein particle complex subunit 10 [Hondaea fermentalgiana]